MSEGPTSETQSSEGDVMRIFTLEEAEATLPFIDECFQRLDELVTRIREVRELVIDLDRYWGESIRSPDHEEHEEYMRLKKERESLEDDIHREIAHLEDSGAVLKDYHSGLIDFHALYQGEIVFLCWQRGEEKIAYWHSITGGFSGRKPLLGL